MVHGEGVFSSNLARIGTTRLEFMRVIPHSSHCAEFIGSSCRRPTLTAPGNQDRGVAGDREGANPGMNPWLAQTKELMVACTELCRCREKTDFTDFAAQL